MPYLSFLKIKVLPITPVILGRQTESSSIKMQNMFFFFIQFSFKMFLVPFSTLREVLTHVILAPYLFDLLILRIKYNFKIFVIIQYIYKNQYHAGKIEGSFDTRHLCALFI